MLEKNQNSGGFTLIEVLVVVLIIGILTSIALPQYQRSVMKSRFATAQQALASYLPLAQVYQDTYNKWPNSFDAFDASGLGGGEIVGSGGGQCTIETNIFCCIFEAVTGWQTEGISCGSNDYSIGIEYYDGRTWCVADNNNGTATKVCQSVGGSPTSLNFITPYGHRTGYTYYWMN